MARAVAYSVHKVQWFDPLARKARALEATVFLDAFGNSPTLLANEYDPYRSGSHFLVVLEEESGDAVGAMRLIVVNPAGFKTLNDIEAGPWGMPVADVLSAAKLSVDALVDVATLAVDSHHRRTGDPRD